MSAPDLFDGGFTGASWVEREGLFVVVVRELWCNYGVLEGSAFKQAIRCVRVVLRNV